MIIMMGAVGSGKGTQSEFLAAAIGYMHLASGDLVRNYASADQRQRMLAGQYLSAEEIIALVEKALEALPDTNKVILDGIPRTLEQSEWLLAGANAGRWHIEAIINLVVTPEIAWERMRSRGREDDTEAAIAARIEFYLKETKPLLELFRNQKLPVYDIDGNLTQDEVKQAIAEQMAKLKLA